MARWQAVSAAMPLTAGMRILCAVHNVHAVHTAQPSPLRALGADSTARQMHFGSRGPATNIPPVLADGTSFDWPALRGRPIAAPRLPHVSMLLGVLPGHFCLPNAYTEARWAAAYTGEPYPVGIARALHNSAMLPAFAMLKVTRTHTCVDATASAGYAHAFACMYICGCKPAFAPQHRMLLWLPPGCAGWPCAVEVGHYERGAQEGPHLGLPS